MAARYLIYTPSPPDNTLGIYSPETGPEMRQQSSTPGQSMREHLWVDIARVTLYWSLALK